VVAAVTQGRLLGSRVAANFISFQFHLALVSVLNAVVSKSCCLLSLLHNEM
jgi:hypothetical protein